MEDSMKTSIKKMLFPLILTSLSACADNPYRPTPYHNGYIIERNYYPQPAYNNRSYIIERDYYNLGGNPYHHRHHAGHHRHQDND